MLVSFQGSEHMLVAFRIHRTIHRPRCRSVDSSSSPHVRPIPSWSVVEQRRLGKLKARPAG